MVPIALNVVWKFRRDKEFGGRIFCLFVKVPSTLLLITKQSLHCTLYELAPIESEANDCIHCSRYLIKYYNTIWQSLIENKQYSVMYFDLFAAFEALYL